MSSNLAHADYGIFRNTSLSSLPVSATNPRVIKSVKYHWISLSTWAVPPCYIFRSCLFSAVKWHRSYVFKISEFVSLEQFYTSENIAQLAPGMKRANSLNAWLQIFFVCTSLAHWFLLPWHEFRSFFDLLLPGKSQGLFIDMKGGRVMLKEKNGRPLQKSTSGFLDWWRGIFSFWSHSGK